jgi:hypothetical protein
VGSKPRPGRWRVWLVLIALAACVIGIMAGRPGQQSASGPDRNVPGATTGAGKNSIAQNPEVVPADR